MFLWEVGVDTREVAGSHGASPHAEVTACTESQGSDTYRHDAVALPGRHCMEA